jgi:hypothetical protein
MEQLDILAGTLLVLLVRDVIQIVLNVVNRITTVKLGNASITLSEGNLTSSQLMEKPALSVANPQG